MRPPHYAGENCEADARAAAAAPRFNEAPALRGGKRDADAAGGLGRLQASMRPPHYAGENTQRIDAIGQRIRGFNEAPALRGGKRGRRLPYPCSLNRFNEAPALRGGKLATSRMSRSSYSALQ